jgi:hypothetical protein
MNDANVAKERAQAILAELETRDPTPLQAWMAQYVAEAISELEKNPANQELRDRCASTIARLWELQLEQVAWRTNRAVDVYRSRTSLDEAALAAIHAEATSEAAPAEDLGPDSAVTLGQLSSLEQLVLELLWASEHLSEEGADGVERLFAETRSKAARKSRETIGKVFPEFANLSLDDYEASRTAVTKMLQSIDEMRRRRLWGSAGDND